MAAVHSLGLHEPSALPYLVAESILPENTCEDDYTWRTFASKGADGTPIEEEILFTESRVIWSRGGVVRRSFAFDIEKEKVVEALFAQFPSSEKSPGCKSDNTTKSGGSSRTSKRGPGDKTRSQLKGKKGRQVTIRTKSDVDVIPGLSLSAARKGERFAKALVVVLKTQVHVFFLAGDSHIVPLPFEVDSVWPTPQGLLFQRKVVEEDPSSLPTAPFNSFVSSQFHTGPRSSGSFRLSGASILSPSPVQRSKLAAKKSRNASLPRVFSLVDPQSEMGLVVTAPSLHDSRSERPFDVIDPAEEILYVSSSNEFPATIHPRSDRDGLVFVVTLNEHSGMYTVWAARYRDKGSALHHNKRRRASGGLFSKRRSSHLDPATGTSTPANRGPSGLRESFAGLNQSFNASTFSQSMNNATHTPDGNGDKTDDLATQLGQEFGDTWNTSRRVSSLLARTDLATSYERSTFSDLAAGNQAGSSVYGRGPRESIGGFNARASFGFSQRSSLPGGNNSNFNNSVSFLDPPIDKFMESLNNNPGDFEGFERMGLAETVSGLPREVILTKVTSHMSGFSTTRGLPAFGKGQKFEVFTISSAHESSAGDTDSKPISVCILNKNSKILTVLTLLAQDSSETESRKRNDKDGNGVDYSVRATDVRNVSNVMDCRRVVDGDTSRILVLSSTADGRGQLTLHAPWGQIAKVGLPSNMPILHPYDVSLTRAPGRSYEAGLKRVFATSGLKLRALGHVSNNGKVTVIDYENRRYRVQLQLEPRSHLVKRALLACRFVLQNSERAGDGVHVSWCEVMKWLKEKGEEDDDLEWTALVVTLFSMAVPFIEDKSPVQPPRKKRKSGGLLRCRSGNSINLDDWEAMLEREAGSSGVALPWMMNPAWGWISEQEIKQTREQAVQTKEVSNLTGLTGQKNNYITRCAALARGFLSSPSGVLAVGPEGYLPVSTARDDSTRRTSLGTILVGLHLIREEMKLSTVSADLPHSKNALLVPVLAQIGAWLGWDSWTWKADSYYGVEISSLEGWAFEEARITKLDVPPEPFTPPSIFDFAESTAQKKPDSFLTIIDVVSSGAKPRGRLWEQALSLTPKTLSLTGFISELLGSQRTVAEKAELLLRWGLTPSVLDTLPDGISASLHEAIVHCQANPPISCNPSLLELVDRDDLYMSMNTEHPTSPPSWPQLLPSHDALRDFHTLGHSIADTNQVALSPEVDRHGTTTLIFNEDRRFNEAMKLLNQMKPPVAECNPEPEWTESDLLEAQKELVQLVILRTLSIPIGRAMANFRARLPLLTEKLGVPSFSLQCVMKPSNVTISADRTGFTEERVSWAFFHNGAATGLTISKHARGIDTSWILYNKPPELTNRHAGFLLALGLNGHLKNLAKWVAFKYLTPKHTMTSIGLLLGLSASYIGTMDTLITRLLSVHVTRMLPPGAAELNLSPLTQTTGIMGIGLLYCGSQHRRMSEVMISEIENLEDEETSIFQEALRDEGYRLAAGFALGLINLGKGKDLGGLRDMRIVERLLALAVGTKNVDLVHILDRTTAGATVALAIIFMKSNDASVADKIDIPDTIVQFDYVRPDIFLLRTLAKHLIMWDSIESTEEWFQKNLPELYRRRYKLTSVKHLSTDDMPFFNIVAGLCFALSLRFAGSGSLEARDLLVAYLDQFIRICRLPVVNYDGKLARNSVRNCQDIVALSTATVMAGTGDLTVFRRLRSLHGRIDGDIPYGSYMAAHIAIGLLFLAGGTYTLGTSDLAVASLLCAFYPVFPTTVLDNKCHLQAFRHLWVLAAEPRCLIPRDLDTRRPVTIPISISLKSGEKKTVMAPCLLPELSDLISITVQSPDHWPFTLDFTHNTILQSKFLSGDQSIYVRRRTAYNTFSSTVFSSTLMALSDLQDIPASANFSTLTRGTAGSSNTATAATATALANNMQTTLHGQQPARNPSGLVLLDWVFNLPSFNHLDMNEKSLVVSPAALQPRFIHTHTLGSSSSSGSGAGLPTWIRTTAIDTRLVLERTVRNLVAAAGGEGAGDEVLRDRLWQLRLLFAWVDALDAERDREGEGQKTDAGAIGMWLRREVVEAARWKVWGVQMGDFSAVDDGV